MESTPSKTYPQSAAWYERAKKSLAGGVSSQFRMFGGPHPMFYQKAAGAHIWDADGNRLLDFTLSQGPMIVGHSHPEVLEAVQQALALGQLYAGQHEQEVLLAEKLQQLIPSANLVRFSSSGSEADQTVLRLARFATKKPRVVKFEGHYHGWFDNVSFNISPSAQAMGPRDHPSLVPWGGGVPLEAGDDLIILPWNDPELLRQVVSERAHEIGAIITEPVMCNQGCIEPQPGFLQLMRELCDQHNITLIFDEIITGFRLDLGGAQRHYGVTPDLSYFGKAMGSGFPISAIVGQHRFMHPLETSQVYHAGTLNGNNASVAAALKTIEVLERNGGEAFEQMVRLATQLRDGLTELTQGTPWRVQGPGPMFHLGYRNDPQPVSEYRHTLAFDTARYARFCEKMLARGVRLIGRGLWYVSTAHTAHDIDQGLATAQQVLAELE
jgi:glutamate-1-semialdehyde 2,1-aminomutase